MREDLDQQEIPDPEDTQVSQEVLVNRDVMVLMVNKEVLENQDNRDPQVPQDPLADLVNLDHKAHKEILDLWDQLERLEQGETVERLDHPDLEEEMGNLDHQVRMDKLVIEEILVQ